MIDGQVKKIINTKIKQSDRKQMLRVSLLTAANKDILGAFFNFRSRVPKDINIQMRDLESLAFVYRQFRKIDGPNLPRFKVKTYKNKLS